MERRAFDHGPPHLPEGPVVFVQLTERSGRWEDLHGCHLGYASVEEVTYADTLDAQRRQSEADACR